MADAVLHVYTVLAGRACTLITRRDVQGTKTHRSKREVPLTSAALAALDRLPKVRTLSRFIFAGPKGGPFDVNNFRRREWGPAIDSAGIEKPARIYDCDRPSHRTRWRRESPCELAWIMGTSVGMFEAHYGAVLDTAHESLLERLDSAMAVG